MGRIITPRFTPRKFGWSSNPKKRAKQLYLLKAGIEYNKAVQRKYGSQGAASEVRRIDQASIDIEGYLK
jgi:hypothetical protein